MVRRQDRGDNMATSDWSAIEAKLACPKSFKKPMLRSHSTLRPFFISSTSIALSLYPPPQILKFLKPLFK